MLPVLARASSSRQLRSFLRYSATAARRRASSPPSDIPPPTPSGDLPSSVVAAPGFASFARRGESGRKQRGFGRLGFGPRSFSEHEHCLDGRGKYLP
jgi:hypothetical protein